MDSERHVALETMEGSGEYAPGERHVLVPGVPQPDGRPRRLVVFFHATDGNERRFLEDEYRPLTAALAAAGFPVISAQFGAGHLWGNDVAVERIRQAWRFGVERAGAGGDALLGVGVSKGATALLNHARARRDEVAAIAALIPAVDLEAAHDRGGHVGPEIEAAYGGGAGYSAEARSHNPAAHAEELSATPIHCWYSTDDPAVPPAEVEGFARRAGAGLTPIGDSGHSIEGLDPAEVVAFFEREG